VRQNIRNLAGVLTADMVADFINECFGAD